MNCPFPLQPTIKVLISAYPMIIWLVEVYRDTRLPVMLRHHSSMVFGGLRAARRSRAKGAVKGLPRRYFEPLPC